MKTIILVLLFLTQVILFSQENQYDEADFSIEVPEGWDAASFPGFPYKILQKPMDKGFRANIKFIREESELPLDSYLGGHIKALKESGMNVLSNKDFETSLKVVGRKLKINTELRGKSLTQVQYIIPGNRSYYLITCSDLKENRNALEADFDTIAKSFQIKRID